MIVQLPIYKQKNFCPNPIVKFGVPKYADSRLNPKVKGTPAHDEFWTEQLYRCIHGYQTGGIFIPGRFYYYMNFNSMATINGIINPDFVDLHYELALLIEHCKREGKNLIVAKKRRAGISEATQKMVVDYGFRFSPSYQAGVAAGQDIYAQDFMKKWRSADSLIVPEFRVKKLTNNDDEVVAGYTIKNTDGENEEGTKNTIYVRTMYKSPNLFKGLFLNDIIAEEAGEFEKLKEFYGASLACLKDGNKQIGTFMIYGTGGNINKGSKDFKEMWYEPDAFNAIKFLITAGRFHKPFYGGCSLEEPKIPNLIKTHKPFELIGAEDQEAAIDAIKKERAVLLKTGDKKGYLDSLQNYPLEEKDIFRKTTVNNFDTEKLNEAEYRIATNPKKYSRWKLEWVKDEKTQMIKMPLTVTAIAAQPEDDAELCFYILDTEHPRKGYSNLYASGLDSYDQDIAKTSKSLGGMCVLIRANNIEGALKKAPVAVICTRPKRKEMFYEMCLKLAVYYNLRSNVLVDVAKPQIIKYFQDRGGEMYLAYRPKKFESEKSEQTHTFGFHLNTYSRPLMTGLMEAAVYYNSKDIWFNHVEELKNGSKIQADLIGQLGNFDEAEVGSDNDLADAYGMSLVQDVSCELNPLNEDEVDPDELFNLHAGRFDMNGEYYHGENQTMLKTDEQDFDGFGL